jgi:hypothetical protein
VIAITVFLLLVPIFIGFGDRLARLFGLRPGPLVERLSLAFVLSVGVVTLAVFGLAVAHKLRLGCAFLAVVMAGAATGSVLQGLRARKTVPWRELLWPAERLDRVLTLLIGAFLGTGLVMALAPPTGMDTGIYHFTIPKVIVQSGGLVPREDIWIHKSGGFYMVYAFGMALGGEILAKLLGYAMAVAGVGLCAAVAERLRAGSGRIAAFILVTTPLSVGYLGYEYLDLPVLTYLLASLVSLQRGSEGRAWTVLSCVFAGLGLSAKSSAFSMAILAPAAVALMIRRERTIGSAAVAAAAVASFGLTAGFWSAWNFATTGSFVHRYPGLMPAARGVSASGSLWADAAKFLGMLTTTGEYWTDSAGPFLLAGLAGFAVFLRRSGSPLAPFLLLASLALYGAGALLAPGVLFSGFGVRYLGPSLVGFGAPLAAQFACWARKQPGLLRGVVLTALLLPAAPLLVLKGGKAAVAAPAALGLERRSTYLGKKIETFAACDIVNGLPAAEVKVLFVAVRPYYLDRPFVWIPYCGEASFLREVRNPEDFIRWVRQQGITHVIYEPAPERDARFQDPDLLFAPPFREIRRWPWKQHEWVRLYELERP